MTSVKLQGTQKTKSFMVPFKVAILSTNTNSFGLRRAILFAKNGHAFEAFPSAYGSNEVSQGDVVQVRVSVREDGSHKVDYSSLGWEMCTRLRNASRPMIADVWAEMPATDMDPDVFASE